MAEKLDPPLFQEVQLLEQPLATHTPGPWGWFNRPYEDGQPYVTIHDGPKRILPNGADASGSENGLHIVGIIKPEDAALIAAAPELLRCLSMAIQDIEQEARGHRPLGFSDGGALDARLRAYRAAIAKARGGSDGR